jgi:hypothetical protein
LEPPECDTGLHPFLTQCFYHLLNMATDGMCIRGGQEN